LDATLGLGMIENFGKKNFLMLKISDE